MERIEIQGEWWLPGAPDNRLSGTLSVDEDGIELALFGALTHPVEDAIPGLVADGEPVPTSTEESAGEAGVYPRIHGQSGSKSYSLDDCFQIHRAGLLGGLGMQRVTVHQVFEGVWFEADEAIAFTEIVVELAGLAEFVQRSGLSEQADFTEEDGFTRLTKTSVTLVPLPSETFVGLDGSECSLVHMWKTGVTEYRERRITENFALRVKYADLQLSEGLLKTVSHVQDLVSVVTNRRAAFTSVSFRHPSVAQELPSGRTASIPIRMYANWVVKPEPNKAPVKSHQVAFNLDDLGGTDALTRWLTVADRHAASLSRVMVSRYSDGTYITDNLLNAAAALEGYDREKNKDKINLVERLKRCGVDAGAPFADLVGDAARFAELLKDYRHDVAHHRSGVGGTTAQVFISRAAVWLLILCMLRDAGAPDVVFEKIAQQPAWRWLKGHLAGVIAVSAPDEQ